MNHLYHLEDAPEWLLDVTTTPGAAALAQTIMMDDDTMHNSTSVSSPFCSSGMMGGGMIMYMEGFKFTLASNEEPCLNLFLPDWTLDTPEKFYAAMGGCLLLAVFVEGLSAWRYRIVRSVKQAHRRDQQQESNTQLLRLVVAVFHGLQGLVGYLLMLAIMTFSVELLLSVVLGLAVGYGVFFQYEEALGRVHVTTNPCCSFLEGEARETMTQEEEDEEEVQGTEILQEAPPPTNSGDAPWTAETTTNLDGTEHQTV